MLLYQLLTQTITSTLVNSKAKDVHSDSAGCEVSYGDHRVVSRIKLIILQLSAINIMFHYAYNLNWLYYN